MEYRKPSDYIEPVRALTDAIIISPQQYSTILSTVVNFIPKNTSDHAVVTQAIAEPPDSSFVPLTNPASVLLSLSDLDLNNETETAVVLASWSDRLDTLVLDNEIISNEKLRKSLPLELQLIIKYADKANIGLSQFLEDDGILLFVKRKKVSAETSEIIYELSQLTGRRMDWLDDLIGHLSINHDGASSFPIKKHFGKMDAEKHQRVAKLIEEFSQRIRMYFQVTPIDKEGNINTELEEALNTPVQQHENMYGEMLIKAGDTEAEVRSTIYALLGSLITVPTLSRLLEGNGDMIKSIMARAFPPLMADSATYWAEVSPFVERNKRTNDKLKQFKDILWSKYKIPIALSLGLMPAGSYLVENLHRNGDDELAGLVYALMPLAVAAITTYSSFKQEYEIGQKLKTREVNGFNDLSKFKLILESAGKTVKQPARLWLLIAGILGLAEGYAMGRLHLLNDPLALTFVGEINESLIACAGIAMHNKIAKSRYKKILRDQLRSL